MAVSFNAIPADIRVPLTYIEFDNSGAVSGTPVMEWRVLLLGQAEADCAICSIKPGSERHPASLTKQSVSRTTRLVTASSATTRTSRSTMMMGSRCGINCLMSSKSIGHQAGKCDSI